MRYPLYNMNCDDFENLTVLICNHILGTSTIPFAKGKDGGKDGKFEGTANCIPSETKPWTGKIIIQAKHTIKIDASCSDSDFNSILNKEVIPSIKQLAATNEINYYLLFTNRKLTGLQDSKIGNLIEAETGITESRIQRKMTTLDISFSYNDCSSCTIPCQSLAKKPHKFFILYILYKPICLEMSNYTIFLLHNQLNMVPFLTKEVGNVHPRRFSFSV